MEILEFNIVFAHEGQKIKASCQKFQVFKKPQIRVAFTFENLEYAFTFYEVKEKGRRFFAWKLNNRKSDALLLSIEAALNKSKNAKQVFILPLGYRTTSELNPSHNFQYLYGTQIRLKEEAFEQKVAEIEGRHTDYFKHGGHKKLDTYLIAVIENDNACIVKWVFEGLDENIKAEVEDAMLEVENMVIKG